MISRMSSGSRRAERAVEPTRSQNMIVTCRRSAMEPDGADGGEVAAEDAGTATVMLAPHSEQNLDRAEFACPHTAQGRGNGAPHSAQNLPPSATFALQLGHCIATAPVDRLGTALHGHSRQTAQHPAKWGGSSRSRKKLANKCE